MCVCIAHPTTWIIRVYCSVSTKWLLWVFLFFVRCMMLSSYSLKRRSSCKNGVCKVENTFGMLADRCGRMNLAKALRRFVAL